MHIFVLKRIIRNEFGDVLHTHLQIHKSYSFSNLDAQILVLNTSHCLYECDALVSK